MLNVSQPTRTILNSERKRLAKKAENGSMSRTPNGLAGSSRCAMKDKIMVRYQARGCASRLKSIPAPIARRMESHRTLALQYFHRPRPVSAAASDAERVRMLFSVFQWNATRILGEWIERKEAARKAHPPPRSTVAPSNQKNNRLGEREGETDNFIGTFLFLTCEMKCFL